MNIEEEIGIVKDFCNIKILYGRKLCLLEEQLMSYQRAIETLLTAYEKEKEKNSKAIDFIKENSHEFYCKRDDLIELEFDDNTNATDLIDILDGNW